MFSLQVVTYSGKETSRSESLNSQSNEESPAF
jgi:hypothetical protein